MAPCPFRPLLAAQSVGALDEAEARDLAGHLAGGCPDCEGELESLSSAAAVLAESVPPRPPPPRLRASLLGRLRRGLRRRSS
jgi:hypothetical protein